LQGQCSSDTEGLTHSDAPTDLTHLAEVDEYIRNQDAEADGLIQKIESDPKQRRRTAELRERLLSTARPLIKTISE